MMNRNMTSLARDRRTARPVFRSFLDGIVLLAFTALLLTVQVTPMDGLAEQSAGSDLQPVQASILPSIHAADDRLPQATACNSPEEREPELEILQDDSEVLVIMVRRGEGTNARIIPAVVRPEV
jgi:hypothetical protein